MSRRARDRVADRHNAAHPFDNVPRRKRFVSLTTFRANGTPVATPLWFGWHEDGIVVITPATASKLKRLRRNPSVLVAPCTSQGSLTGSAREGRGEFVPAADRRSALRAIARRYPIPAAVLWLEMWRRGRRSAPVYLKIVEAHS